MRDSRSVVLPAGDSGRVPNGRMRAITFQQDRAAATSSDFLSSFLSSIVSFPQTSTHLPLVVPLVPPFVLVLNRSLCNPWVYSLVVLLHPSFFLSLLLHRHIACARATTPLRQNCTLRRLCNPGSHACHNIPRSVKTKRL